MDPNATLEEIRGIVIDRIDFNNDGADFDRLLELVAAMDTWLTQRGFLPKDWTSTRDVCAEPLRAIMEQIRADSDSTDPMEPFAYDSRWEELAKAADAALAVVYPDLGGSDGSHQTG